MKSISTGIYEQKMALLPPNLRQQAADFIEYLLSKTKKTKAAKKIKYTWAGKLSKLKHQYSSVALQKKSLDWWQ